MSASDPARVAQPFAAPAGCPAPEEEAREALGRGDLDGAITLLMRAFGDDLYRHCRQVLGDACLADDVHQTVFVEAYRDLPRFAGRSSLRTWLYGIARHRCLDALKATRRFRLRFSLGSALPERADERAAADERLVDRARRQALERGLARLAPKARIALLLRYQEGLSYEEMAGISGERAKTLQARVARAVLRLRKYLEASDAL